MPLSENEQRILAEIEKHLEESDPLLAREVRRPSIGAAPLSSWWAVLAVVAGFGIMLTTLQIHPLLSFTGFITMLVGGLAIERNLRAIVERTMEQTAPAVSGFFRSSRSDSSSGDSQSDD